MCDPSIAAAFPCAVLVPQCPAQFDWLTPIDGEKDMLDIVRLMISEALLDNRIDPQRVYLAGFSMGAFGAWELAARAPDRFAAVVPIAGGGSPAIAPQLVNVQLWAVHGAADDVVPVEQSRSMIEAIQNCGGNPKFTEYPAVGHGAWRKVFQADSETLAWMFKRSRQEMMSVRGE
jgi:predicted peptidase